jgi:hypothetical protein
VLFSRVRRRNKSSQLAFTDKLVICNYKRIFQHLHLKQLVLKVCVGWTVLHIFTKSDRHEWKLCRATSESVVYNTIFTDRMHHIFCRTAQSFRGRFFCAKKQWLRPKFRQNLRP